MLSLSSYVHSIRLTKYPFSAVLCNCSLCTHSSDLCAKYRPQIEQCHQPRCRCLRAATCPVNTIRLYMITTNNNQYYYYYYSCVHLLTSCLLVCSARVCSQVRACGTSKPAHSTRVRSFYGTFRSKTQTIICFWFSNSSGRCCCHFLISHCC